MKRINKQKRLVFELTVSGLSVAFVLIFLVAAQFSPVLKLSFFVLAGVALLLPCIVESFWGLIMSFLAGGSLALLISPVNVVPFALFFGLQIILMYVCKRWLKNKWFICIPIKLVVLEVGVYGIYRLYGISYIENLFSNFGWSYNYWFVMLITIPFVIAYDYAVQIGYKTLYLRLNKVVCKYTDKVKVVNQKKSGDAVQNQPINIENQNNNSENNDDPFGEM